MRIVVLVKLVPDPAAGLEGLRADGRIDRSAAPAVVNGNDEYALEAALKLVEANGGEVTIVTMAPAASAETIRKALAMGAHRGVHVSDDALAGSCALSTAKVLAATLKEFDYDLVLAGADSSDSGTGVVHAGVATLLALPYLSYAAKIELSPDAGMIRVRRISPTGYDILEAPMPALVACTQVLGEPRYPSLRGIIAARSTKIVTKTLTDVGVPASEAGGVAATTTVFGWRQAPNRGPRQVIRAAPDEAAREIVAFLGQRGLI